MNSTEKCFCCHSRQTPLGGGPLRDALYLRWLRWHEMYRGGGRDARLGADFKRFLASKHRVFELVLGSKARNHHVFACVSTMFNAISDGHSFGVSMNSLAASRLLGRASRYSVLSSRLAFKRFQAVLLHDALHRRASLDLEVPKRSQLILSS